VRLLKQGCLLGERIVSLPVWGVEAVLETGFTPNEGYDDAENDGVLAKAVLGLTASLEPLFRKAAESLLCRQPLSDPFVRTLVFRYLDATLRGDLPVAMLLAFMFHPDEAERLAAEGGDAVVPALSLGVGVSRGPAAEQADGQPAEPVHPLSRLPIFRTLDGQWLSLLELDEGYRRLGALPYTDSPVPPGTRSEKTILVLDAPEREILERIFLPAALRDAGRELEEHAMVQVHGYRPVEPLQPAGTVLASVPFAGEGFEGVLAVTEEAIPSGSVPDQWTWPRRARVRILRDRRVLGTRELLVPFGPLRGVVDAKGIRANREWSDVDDPPFVARIAAALPEAATRLLGVLCEQYARLEALPRAAARRLLLAAAAAPFATEEFRRGWNLVLAAHGADEAVRQYLAVLQVAAGRELVEMQAGFELLGGPGHWTLAQGADVGAALGGLLGPRLDPPKDAPPVPPGLFDAWFRPMATGGAVPVPDPLLRLPLLEALSGASVSLAHVSQVLARDGHVPYVDAALPEAPDADLFAVRLGNDDLATLRLALGAELLDDVTREARLQRQKVALTERPELPGITLVAGQAIVTRPVAVDPVTGEVGLAADLDAGGSGLLLTVCSQRRFVARVKRESKHALIAILNDDRLVLSDEAPDGIPAADIERLAGLCEEQAPQLLMDLVRGWGARSAVERSCAWRHVLDRFAGEPPRRLAPVLKLRDPMLERLAGVEGFRMADGGSVSLAMLAARARACGAVLFVPEEAIEQVPPELRFWIAVLRPFEAQRLSAMFDRVLPWSALEETERADVRRRIGARPLPDPEQAQSLARKIARMGGIEACLYLPRAPGTLEVVFGREEREVQRRPLSDVFPCAGVVQGDGLAVRPGFAEVELSPAQESWLDGLGLALYADLARELKPLRKRDPEGAAVAERYLADVLVRLAREKERPSVRPQSVPRKNLMGALSRQKLFALADGRRLTLAQVREQRPPALAELGLWAVESKAASEDGSGPVAGAGPEASVAPAPSDGAPPAAGSAAVETPDGADGPAQDEVGAAAAGVDAPEPQPVEVRFLAAVAAELRRLRGAPGVSFGRFVTDELSLVVGSWETIAEPKGTGIELHTSHPVVRHAMETFERDPIVLAFVASAAYTAYNLQSPTISDEEEAVFQRELAGRSIPVGGAG